MSRHWAVLIGVNQYQLRQPLLCAHDDAQSMYRFLTDEAGLSKQSCVLLSDRAPKIADTSTYPTSDTLKNWLGGLGQAGIQPDDTLWIFFSGYGECWSEQDYLLPLDADVQCSPKTWLSVRSLYSMLSQLPSKNILMLLDISRSQSSRADNRLGRQTMQNAKEFGISTILSCQPEQFSHESAALGNGFFTAALLEGLRSQASQPLIKLVRFLQVRLPELSEHHQRPRQDPIIMVAPALLEQWHLPSLKTGQPQAPVNITVQQPTSPTSTHTHTTPRAQAPKTTNPSPPDTILQSPSTITANDLTSSLSKQKPSTANPPTSAEPLTGRGDQKIPTTTIPRPAISLDEVSQPVNPQPPRRRPRSTPEEELDTRKVLLQILVLGALLTVVLGLAKTLWRGEGAPSLLNVSKSNKVPSSNSPTAPSQAKAPAPSSSPMPTAPSP
ncbi:caspase family protein, partial [filamentous cyanobacterium LEGE 11480]